MSYQNNYTGGFKQNVDSPNLSNLNLQVQSPSLNYKGAAKGSEFNNMQSEISSL